MSLTSQHQRVGAVASPLAPVTMTTAGGQLVVPAPLPYGGTCGAYTPIIGPVAIPLYPPIIEDRRRRLPEAAGVSVNIAPGQTLSGLVLFAGTNFIHGRINVSGNSITVRRPGRYILDVNINVSYSAAGSALFQSNPGYGSNITGGTVTAAGVQVYSGSTTLQLGRGSSVSISAILTNATITGGVVSLQMVPETGRRRRDREDFYEDEFFYDEFDDEFIE